MIQLLMHDEEAEFIFTSGNDPTRYAKKERLYEIALKYKKNQKLSIKNLEEAIDDVFKENNNVANFIVGSFYTYGTVVNKLNNLNYMTKSRKLQFRLEKL